MCIEHLNTAELQWDPMARGRGTLPYLSPSLWPISLDMPMIPLLIPPAPRVPPPRSVLSSHPLQLT